MHLLTSCTPFQACSLLKPDMHPLSLAQPSLLSWLSLPFPLPFTFPTRSWLPAQPHAMTLGN